jgi:hypothetical protein
MEFVNHNRNKYPEDYFERDLLKHQLELMGIEYPYQQSEGSMETVVEDGKIGVIFRD